MAVYNGKIPDRVPVAFWYHFPPDCRAGENAVSAHLRFFEESGSDLCKVMNENTCPDNPKIKEAADWSNLEPFSPTDEYFVRQIDLVKKVTEAVNGEAVVLATVHGLVASAYHTLGGTELYDHDGLILTKHMRENPEGMMHAFRMITDYLKNLCRACIDAGADGIYFASLGGERKMFTDEEFAKFIKPFEIEILESIGSVPAFNVLHMCKNDLNLKRYLDYPCRVLNWGVFEDNISLQEGRELFGKDKIYLGGMDDRAGVIVDGELEEITQFVKDLIKSFGTENFILGADCTLPTNIDSARLRAAIEGTK